MAKILVTGGGGYIGSHTIVDLVNHGYEVISIDNFSRGYEQMFSGINLILQKNIKNYNLDLCNIEDLRAVFEENNDISGVIHFAAYKSVPESVEKPLLYFQNNLTSLVNMLQCIKEYEVKSFIFSSSCSVYGNPDALPVTESTPFKKAESPYARTKQMGEQICEDFIASLNTSNIVLLRYFNPVGAHPTALIGEYSEKPENLVPVITQTAIGKRGSMTVFGNDYDTRDGSCIRDYIHVMDIAHAHTLALKKSLNDDITQVCDVYNLGTGNGVTVLELIKAFEKVSQVKLNYNLGPRRPGDVIEVFANNEKAKNELNWTIKFDIEAMMETAWKWETYLDKLNKTSWLN